jgi:hypothetical protein
MNEEIEERIEQELGNHPNKDVLVYYRRDDFEVTWGFYVWNGHSHTHTTLTEFLADGFEKSDIKELRDEADKFMIIDKSVDEFEIKRL